MSAQDATSLAAGALADRLDPEVILVMVNEAGAILDVRRAAPNFLLAQLAAQAAPFTTIGGDACNNLRNVGRCPWRLG